MLALCPNDAMSARDENISNADFGRLRSLIYAQSGISLNAEKKTMLELRIKRRLRSLNLNSFGEYCDYLFGPHGEKEELVHLLDVVSTNKTDFFREPEHFEFLVEKAIPDLVARNQSGRPLLIWSAGCSTGEEPYTLAMMLNECVAAASRFSVQDTGHRYLHQGAGPGRARGLPQRSRGAGAAGVAAKVLHAQPRSRLQCIARGSGIAANWWSSGV